MSAKSFEIFDPFVSSLCCHVQILRSIKDVNKPKFLAHDIPLFEGILRDLFPGIDLPDTDYKVGYVDIISIGHKSNDSCIYLYCYVYYNQCFVYDWQLFIEAAEECCKKHNVQLTDYFLEKLIQTYEMMKVRHGYVVFHFYCCHIMMIYHVSCFHTHRAWNCLVGNI